MRHALRSRLRQGSAGYVRLCPYQRRADASGRRLLGGMYQHDPYGSTFRRTSAAHIRAGTEHWTEYHRLLGPRYIAQCSETFQVCYDDDGEETCGNCINRYVEWPPPTQDVNDPSPCVLIEDLPWEDFLAYFEEQVSILLQIFVLYCFVFVRVRFEPTLYILLLLLYFQVVYLDELSPEDRIKLLYIVLRIISGENSQVPPLPYKLGINKFAADTAAERETLSATFYDQEAVEEFGDQFGRFELTNRELENLPEEKNWVDEGAVTDVVDQGRCGCCWALSVMGAAEGAAAINPDNKGFLQRLSIQQLISCDDNQLGCGGGAYTLILPVDSVLLFPVCLHMHI